MQVTIAIPFFNAEDILADAIRSVFAQTCQGWELLLIDDGSTDESLAIARQVTDPRVRVRAMVKAGAWPPRSYSAVDPALHVHHP